MTYLTKPFEKGDFHRLLALFNFWKSFIHNFTWRVTGPNFLNFCRKLGQYVRQIRSVGKCLCVKASLFVCSVSFTCQLLKQWKDMSLRAFCDLVVSAWPRGSKSESKNINLTNFPWCTLCVSCAMCICVFVSRTTSNAVQRRLMAVCDIEPQASQQLVLMVYFLLGFWANAMCERIVERGQ